MEVLSIDFIAVILPEAWRMMSEQIGSPRPDHNQNDLGLDLIQ